MQWFESINRIQSLHKLIENECSGTPCELAKHFCLSKRQLYNIIEELKIMGADIKYSKDRCTFYYANEFEFKLDFHVSYINKDNGKNIYGGSHSVAWYVSYGIGICEGIL